MPAPAWRAGLRKTGSFGVLQDAQLEEASPKEGRIKRSASSPRLDTDEKVRREGRGGRSKAWHPAPLQAWGVRGGWCGASSCPHVAVSCIWDPSSRLKPLQNTGHVGLPPSVWAGPGLWACHKGFWEWAFPYEAGSVPT